MTKLKTLKKIFERIRSEVEEKKIELLLAEPIVQKELERERLLPLYLALEKELRLIFLYVVLFEQGHLLHHHPASDYFLKHLVKIDSMYKEIGGLFGYFLKAIKDEVQEQKEEWVVPKYEKIEEVKIETLFLGCKSLDKCAVAVPLGGMGQRLGYRDEEGPLPVAQFPFLGHSLLEQIVRDLEGLESLYKILFNKEIEIPLILMCSREKSNESKVRELLEKEVFFGRKKIKLLVQELVPVVTEEGHFSFDGKEFLCFPSGHGAIWKLVKEEKVFEWLEHLGISYLILRQINNPLAALDTQFCAFLGSCVEQKSSFGLVGLRRILGFSEGVLVEKQREKEHFITNVEYVEIAETSIEKDLRYLANANILFADVDAVKKKLDQNLFRGLIVNRKHLVPQLNKDQELRWVKGAALEGMMQNLVEMFSFPLEESLPVLIMRMERENAMSAIKTLEGEKENPLLATYDFLKNSYKLLVTLTKNGLKPFCSLEEFKRKGANYTFMYHPSLGPFYERIRNKIFFLEIAEGSILELEIEKFFGRDLVLDGHLEIKGGVCIFERVEIRGNCKIEVEEGGELVAKDLLITGEHFFKIPKNRCMRIEDQKGQLNLIDRDSVAFEEEKFCQLFSSEKQAKN